MTNGDSLFGNDLQLRSVSDPHDETVPAYGEPVAFQHAAEDLAMRDAALHAMTRGAMGSAVIRDDSTPPAIPNSGAAAPIDGDAWE